MSKNLEIEFKTMLSEKDFLRVADYFHLEHKDFFVQTNTYFDTQDFQLKQMNAGLRVRTFADSAEITLKLPHDTGLLETTDPISVDQANEIIQSEKLPKTGEVFQSLKQLNIVDPLHTIGQLKTKRAQKKLPQGLLAIDESWYNNDHDYELELEVTDALSGKKAFDDLLALLQIEEIKAPNKIQRMISSSL